jgi:hypothetical protein
VCKAVSWGSLTAPGGQIPEAGGLTALGCENEFAPCFRFPCCIAVSVQGECALAQG